LKPSPTPVEIAQLGFFLEGFLFGLYCGIFAIYLKYHASSQEARANKAKTIVFYALSVLFVLSIANMVLGVATLLADVNQRQCCCCSNCSIRLF